MEPLACVVHAALELTHVTTGDLVLVSGPGAIGLSALQVAKAQGAKVIAAGTAQDTKRLEIAKQPGADLVVDVTQKIGSLILPVIAGVRKLCFRVLAGEASSEPCQHFVSKGVCCPVR